MTNNRVVRDVNPLDVESVARVQNSLLRAYTRLGTWRKVGEYYGVAYRYCWDLALHGVVPNNKDIRYLLGLPKRLPSERKPKALRSSWRDGLAEGLKRL